MVKVAASRATGSGFDYRRRRIDSDFHPFGRDDEKRNTQKNTPLILRE
jgi:hypothetical protein